MLIAVKTKGEVLSSEAASEKLLKKVFKKFWTFTYLQFKLNSANSPFVSTGYWCDELLLLKKFGRRRWAYGCSGAWYRWERERRERRERLSDLLHATLLESSLEEFFLGESPKQILHQRICIKSSKSLQRSATAISRNSPTTGKSQNLSSPLLLTDNGIDFISWHA